MEQVTDSPPGPTPTRERPTGAPPPSPTATSGAHTRGDARADGREPLASRWVVGALIAAAVAAAAVVLRRTVAADHGDPLAPTAGGPMHGRAATTVNRPVSEVYARWRALESLPTFMDHLLEVTVTDAERSHWVARSPLGGVVEWEAELIADVPDRLLAWRSVEGTGIDNAGLVRFRPAPGDRGTEVVVELAYAPPLGAVGDLVARLLGEEPVQQIKDDLRRFKQVVETGEVVRSEGSPRGTSTHNQRHQEPAHAVA